MNETASCRSAGSERLDRWGILISLGCTIHCLAAPLLFLFLPTIAGIWAHPASHALIALVVLPLAGTVLLRGFRLHRRRWVLAAAAFGVLAILVGCVLPYCAPAAEAGAEHAHTCCPHVETESAAGVTLDVPTASLVTMIGSLLLVAAHLGNLRACRGCRGEGRRVSPSAAAATPAA